MANDRWRDERRNWDDPFAARDYGRSDYGRSDYGGSRFGRERYGRFDRDPGGYGQAYRPDEERGWARDQGEYRGSDQSRSYGEDYDPPYRSATAGAYGDYGRTRDRDLYSGRTEDRWRGEEGRDWWDRTKDQFRAWGGDDDARRRREMDEIRENRGRGPRGYVRSDDRIREDVSDRLSDDWRVDASDIEVSVNGGEVTLSGTVTSRDDKRRAEDLVEQCSGVKHVQNNLRVQGRSGASAIATGSPETVRDVTDG